MQSDITLFSGRRIRPRLCHFILRHEFLHSFQPSFILIELSLVSNEFSGVKKQTENAQNCAGAHREGTVFKRHRESWVIEPSRNQLSQHVAVTLHCLNLILGLGQKATDLNVIASFFLSQYISLRWKNPKLANKRYIVRNQIFYKFFWRLIDGHFENVRIQVTWCDTSHVCKAVKSVMSRPENNTSPSLSSCCWNLRAKKEIRFVSFCYRPPFRDYEIRSEK